MKIKNMFIIAMAAISMSACSRVEPGHVGVKVNQYGSGAGVSGTALGVGTYWAGPGTTIYVYPVYTSTYAWSKSGSEGSGANEEFSFQDKSGLVVTADVSVAYRVDPVKAPILFQKYRTDMDGVVAGPMRNAVRAALVEQASIMSVEEIYGPKKTDLINAALVKVNKYFEPFGLHVEQLYWASSIRIPQSILEQINARTKNEQQALAAQANLATVEADAKSRIAEAHGNAEAQRLEAESLRSSPELIKKMWIERWDGTMPNTVYCNSATPCVTTGQ